jgi:hypothetical protein
MSSTEAYVFVAQLETVLGQGWTSVHTTRAAADSRIDEKIAAWGLDDPESDDVRAYGVGLLPIEGDVHGLAARILSERMTRWREVVEYADARDIDVADAIIELVNSGLSHR